MLGTLFGGLAMVRFGWRAMFIGQRTNRDSLTSSGEAMPRTGITSAAMLLWLGVAVQGQPPQSAADVAPAIIVTVPSAALGSEQQASILLPAMYATSRQRYPVLYLLHGGGQDHTAFAMRGWFRALAAREMIIVTPNAGESWYVNSVADPKAMYEDFVINDLVKYVDSRYRTVASRDGRAVAGISMGAWGAMLLGLKHPQVFGAIGALSAPFGISRQDPKMDMTSRTQQRFGAPDTPERQERDPASLVATLALDSVPMLYLVCGNQDLFVADNRGFVQRLTARKIPYEYRELSPYGHSWDLWGWATREFHRDVVQSLEPGLPVSSPGHGGSMNGR